VAFGASRVPPHPVPCLSNPKDLPWHRPLPVQIHRNIGSTSTTTLSAPPESAWSRHPRQSRTCTWVHAHSRLQPCTWSRVWNSALVSRTSSILLTSSRPHFLHDGDSNAAVICLLLSLPPLLILHRLSIYCTATTVLAQQFTNPPDYHLLHHESTPICIHSELFPSRRNMLLTFCNINRL
jgi:hypothetical protein